MGHGFALRHRDPARAAARTSAARRPRSSTRSRAFAASRATSRRSRCRSGVFGKPTVVNNVETLVNVLEILRIGGPAYAAIGTEASTGPRLFCLSGCVARPGVYEVPFGATLRQMLDLAGGVAGGPHAPGDPARRRGGRVRAARRARHAAHLRGRARREGDAGLRRHHGVRRHDRHGADPPAGSRRSSATSRAASACRAASAPCGRRRRSTGSQAAQAAGRRARRAGTARGDRLGDEGRIHLRPGTDRVQRGRVGDQAARACSTERRDDRDTVHRPLVQLRAAAPDRRAHDRRRDGAGARRHARSSRPAARRARRSRRSATSRRCTR